MTESLRVRVGAVALVLVTFAAIVFGVLNFRQSMKFEIADDGVSWEDTTAGIRARNVSSKSPAEQAGIKNGDILLSINDAKLSNAIEVTQRLTKPGVVWTQLNYELVRNGSEFIAPLVAAPSERSSLQNYLRFVGVVYLFIGVFIFLRRWSAARALHFYIFCLVSFILLHLPLHWKTEFALIKSSTGATYRRVSACRLRYCCTSRWCFRNEVDRDAADGIAMLILRIFGSGHYRHFADFALSVDCWDSPTWVGARIELDQILHGLCGTLFPSRCRNFSAKLSERAQRNSEATVEMGFRRHRSGDAVCAAVYCALRFLLTVDSHRTWQKLSALSLALVPLCFAYAIIRYRLMDVDVIFKRGLAYTAATAGVVAVYFLVVASVGELFHSTWPQGPTGGTLAIVLAAFLLQPFRDWTQRRLDRFFYRDRLDYRRTLIEFGRTLTNEVHIERRCSAR